MSYHARGTPEEHQGSTRGREQEHSIHQVSRGTGQAKAAGVLAKRKKKARSVTIRSTRGGRE